MRARDLLRRVIDAYASQFPHGKALRWTVAAIVLGAPALGFAVHILSGPHSTTLRYLSRYSNVEITGPLRDLDEPDNGNGLSAFYAVLEPRHARTLIERNAFHVCSTQEHPHHVIGLLRPEHDRLPPPDRLRCLSGTAHRCVSWTYMVDPATSRLWIDVHYPDWGGDPLCDD